MLRTHTCGELRLQHIGISVTLCGWVQKIRNKGSLVWIDLRDRYGITQLILEEHITAPEILSQVQHIGREYVIQATGSVIERSAKNPSMPTGDIEIEVKSLTILNTAKTPPFLIEEQTDGGEELRMQYRYLDLRRPPLQKNLLLRQLVAQHARAYLEQHHFVDVETPLLIKSTPGGARDFVVPSRIHPQQFYALPQSPQIFKQLLMVAGLDRYYQIAKCFRDEDFRADRQPEFTQIDCELSFVTQADILHIFENFTKYIFEATIQVRLDKFPCITYAEAMQKYGTDKPDIRFGMRLIELTELVKNSEFPLFKQAKLIAGICVKGCADYTRKQLDDLTEYIKKLNLVTSGLVYVKYLADGSFNSPVSKFYDVEQLTLWAKQMHAVPGDLLLILAGEIEATQIALGSLRLKLRDELHLVSKDKFAPLWVVDFPLLEWNEESQRYVSRHHPFTSPKQEDIELLSTKPETVRANAYDLVINGMEIGGGSIRIHDRALQEQIFNVLGFSEEEARQQFGFLTDAFEYGAPPHGGIAFGFDRLCAIIGREDSIRPFIAFPKNNAGRDVMMKAPSTITEQQISELGIILSK
ncbi:aspartyl-tRNA synthetase [Candidatus Amoebophilus asiaticus 5a2]|uniref:Aspartate--tRNA ligase n=1 Tax=Amoebophilus asiaticus (strain 5a2) TaxID=452471 RepID=SYD_AMOA5|nr:aspartate--tRNA ligase [Candidatus Amoebophilus asiaticus]B3EUH5.1 RecName: Full=Aspartate--tRNA ligase; AltName: Full=Aspartyl-tRNA synthetase; Short=AspRS [Candidatus Amoebophilus asiaticus 5a2]ACE05594.1 aspartyl-tRNA synthetase [Candidatus Amoebophilus asiaticus 5a2]